MKKWTIGVPQSGYNVERNIPLVDGFDYRRPWDINRFRTGIGFHLEGKLDKYHQFTFSAPYAPKVDLLHFFNTISTTRTPWITTYEDKIPRWWNQRNEREVDRAIETILDDACKSIIAFSSATENVLMHFFDSRGYQSDWVSMMNKRHVLLPPQRLFSMRKRRPGPTRFCFIGGDFYRKGGGQTISAFYELYHRGIRDWELTVVGNLSSWGDYASKTTIEDEILVRRMFAEMDGNIHHCNSLPNAQVLDLLADSHYLLFPTFQDTFGYVVLEAMANGCVPLVSRTRVFPEVIDHGVNGFLIDLPVDENGDAHKTATSDVEKSRLSDKIKDAIIQALEREAATWLHLSEGCRRHVRQVHSPKQFTQELTNIYGHVLGL